MKKLKNPNDNLTFFWFILSNLIPLIGLYLFFKFVNHSPNRAKLALISALIGSLIAIIIINLLNI